MRGKYGTLQHGIKHNGTDHYQLFFTSDTDLDCYPPYKKGQRDMVWTTHKPDMNNKLEVEKAVGLYVQEHLPNKEV